MSQFTQLCPSFDDADDNKTKETADPMTATEPAVRFLLEAVMLSSRFV